MPYRYRAIQILGVLMALEKQSVTVNFSQAANQKADPKQVTPETPTLIENCRFQKAGRIDKRWGYEAYSNNANDRVLGYYTNWAFYETTDVGYTTDRVFLTSTDGGATNVAMNFYVASSSLATDFGNEVALALGGGDLVSNNKYYNESGGTIALWDKAGTLWQFVSDGSVYAYIASAATYNNKTVGFYPFVGGAVKGTIYKNGVATTAADLWSNFSPYSSVDKSIWSRYNPKNLMIKYFSSGVGAVTAAGTYKNLIGTPEHLLLRAGSEVFNYNRNRDTWHSAGYYNPVETEITSPDETSKLIVATDSAYDAATGIIYYAALRSIIKQYPNTGTITAFPTSVLEIMAIDEKSGEVLFEPTPVSDSLSTLELQYATLHMVNVGGVTHAVFSNQHETSGLVSVYAANCMPHGIGSAVFLAFFEGYSGEQMLGQTWDVMPHGDDKIVLAGSGSGLSTKATIKFFSPTLENMDRVDSDFSGTSTEDKKCWTLSRTSKPVEDPDYPEMMLVGVGATEDKEVIYTKPFSYTTLVDDADAVVWSKIAKLDPGSGSESVESIVCNPMKDPLYRGHGVLLMANVDSASALTETDIHRWWLGEENTAGSGADTSRNIATSYGLKVLSRGVEEEGQYYNLYYRSAPADTCYFLACALLTDETITTMPVKPSCQFLWGLVPDEESSYRPRGGPYNLSEVATSQYRMSVVSTDSYSATPGVQSVKVDFDSPNLFSGIGYGNSVVVAGSNLHAFGGQFFRELGFYHSPRKPTLSASSSGGFTTAGVYQVVVVYEFADKNGYLHRSAPSPIQSVSASANRVIACTIETYLPSNLPTDAISLTKIIPYRTTAGGSIFYRETYYDDWYDASGGFHQGLPLVHNNTTNATITIELWKPDSLLEESPKLDFSVEIAPNPVPPATSICNFGNRLWIAGAASDEAVYYSKLNKANIMPEFTPAFSISIQDKPGRSTGISGLADKIVLAKRDRLYASYGNGPNDLGLGGDFAPFEEISMAGGAIEPKSLGVTKNGLTYNSLKGVYTLDGSLQTQYSGAMFEDTLDEPILRTLTPPDSETLRYVMGKGVLSYDTLFNAWSLDYSTALSPVDACVYNNGFNVLSSTAVYREVENRGVDGAATHFNQKIITGWISLNGVAGFQRLYKLFLVFKNVATGYTGKVSVAYDYNETYTDEVEWAGTLVASDQRLEIYATKQKCEAFRLKIETTGATSSQAFDINFLSIVFGAKKGLPKQLPQAQRLGMTTI